MTSLRPLAVGLLGRPDHWSERDRRAARVAMVLLADRKGYCLTETVEAGSIPIRSEASFWALEAQIVRHNVKAVFYAGSVDTSRLAGIVHQFGVTAICSDALEDRHGIASDVPPTVI